MEIGGESVFVDAADCQIYEIQSGDSAYGLAAQFNVPAEAIIAVNRHTQESIQLLQPGDTLCIPKVIYGETLPPTPGPTPTPSPTGYPPGPTLLYPVNEAVIDPPEAGVTLQWVAVQDLREDEQYMVELADMNDLDALPYRGFTRDTAFKVPADWRPALFEPEPRRFRWRVSIVRVTGQRADGKPLYTYGGQSSEDAFFTWLSATPTPTATPTPPPTATPTAEE